LARAQGPLPDGHELEVLGAGVVGGRPDDLAVDALLDDVRRPAGWCGAMTNSGVKHYSFGTPIM